MYLCSGRDRGWDRGRDRRRDRERGCSIPHPIRSAGELDGAKVRCVFSIIGAIACTGVPMINAS